MYILHKPQYNTFSHACDLIMRVKATRGVRKAERLSFSYFTIPNSNVNELELLSFS